MVAAKIFRYNTSDTRTRSALVLVTHTMNFEEGKETEIKKIKTKTGIRIRIK